MFSKFFVKKLGISYIVLVCLLQTTDYEANYPTTNF